MSTQIVGQEDKRHQKKLTILRLFLLLSQLTVILSNRLYDANLILTVMPELNSTQTAEFKTIEHAFRAANTMGLVLLVMQLIILYVGTTRYRLKPTIYCAFLHVVGTFAYWHHSRWQFENMWTIFHLFSFLPLISQILICLFTAKA